MVHNLSSPNESNQSFEKEQPSSRIEQRIRAEIAQQDIYIEELEDDIAMLQKHMDAMADKKAKLLVELEQAQAEGVVPANHGKGQKMGDGDVTFVPNDSLEKCRKS